MRVMDVNLLLNWEWITRKPPDAEVGRERAEDELRRKWERKYKRQLRAARRKR